MLNQKVKSERTETITLEIGPVLLKAVSTLRVVERPVLQRMRVTQLDGLAMSGEMDTGELRDEVQDHAFVLRLSHASSGQSVELQLSPDELEAVYSTIGKALQTAPMRRY